jgi:hypothetical protein
LVNMKFIVYCMEVYRNAKNISGKEVYDTFSNYGVIDFIDEFYDILHSTGNKDIIWQIDEYIKHRSSQSVHYNSERN